MANEQQSSGQILDNPLFWSDDKKRLVEVEKRCSDVIEVIDSSKGWMFQSSLDEKFLSSVPGDKFLVIHSICEEFGTAKGFATERRIKGKLVDKSLLDQAKEALGFLNNNKAPRGTTEKWFGVKEREYLPGSGMPNHTVENHFSVVENPREFKV